MKYVIYKIVAFVILVFLALPVEAGNIKYITGEWYSSYGKHQLNVINENTFLGHRILEDNTTDGPSFSVVGHVVVDDNGIPKRMNVYGDPRGLRLIGVRALAVGIEDEGVRLLHKEELHNRKYGDSISGYHLGMTLIEATALHGLPKQIEEKYDVKNPGGEETWVIPDKGLELYFSFGVLRSMRLKGNKACFDKSGLSADNTLIDYLSAYSEYALSPENKYYGAQIKFENEAIEISRDFGYVKVF